MTVPPAGDLGRRSLEGAETEFDPRRRRRGAHLPAPLAAGVLVLAAALPMVLDPYHVIVLSSALVLAIACLGVNLLLGYTGLLSLGHAAYFGIGAYAGAFLFTFGDMMSLEVHLASGVLAAAALGSIVGLLCVRATRIFFAILTLAFAQVVHSLFVSGAAFRPFGEHGKGYFLIGHGGLYIPRFTLFGAELAPEVFNTVFYYVILAAFLAAVAVMWRLVHSPFGLALRAIRDNTGRAALVGIPVRRYRWGAFVLSAVFAGLAGGLAGQLDRQVTPQQLDWPFSAYLVVATMLGGKAHFWGPVLGAFAVVVLREIALRFTDYHGLLLGSMLVVVVLAAPAGLAGAAGALASSVARIATRRRR
jgi:branched-chain amino acid transport system permease protein